MSGFKRIFDRDKEGEPSDSEPVVPSKGLIACNGSGRGIVLAYVGTSITWHAEMYSTELDELGLDDAPQGLSIWEGEMGSVQVNTADGIDFDFEATGNFRPLTQEEWITLSKTGEPWEQK